MKKDKHTDTWTHRKAGITLTETAEVHGFIICSRTARQCFCIPLSQGDRAYGIKLIKEEV